VAPASRDAGSSIPVPGEGGLKAVVSDRDPGAAFHGFAGAGVGRPPPQPARRPALHSDRRYIVTGAT